MRFFEFGLEMGRKKNCIFGVVRKVKEREGKKDVFWFGREMGRTK